MSAVADNVIAVPGPIKAPAAPSAVQPMEAGDIVVVCFNATLPIWCAFPVAAVDDDGVVIAVATRTGRVVCASRVSCEPTVYGVRAAHHDSEGFASLRWKTWGDPAEAVAAFSAIGTVKAAP